MIELIRHIATSLVEDKDSVEVKEIDQEDAQVIELHVAPDDLGKVIGKQGRTARAMRSLLAAATVGSGKDIRLEIVE
ncbi:MAG: KH domain-containing protein [Proteobacteria bacterium]|jgi:hypothetical protein|nr:KH domain-containing protein [Pseudomonadota bacterium]MBU1639940.1 KH domain-containing protein [Pseudomonadota bacterium]